MVTMQSFPTRVFVRLIAVLDSSKFSRVDIMPDISAVIERERAELLQ